MLPERSQSVNSGDFWGKSSDGVHCFNAKAKPARSGMAGHVDPNVALV